MAGQERIDASQADALLRRFRRKPLFAEAGLSSVVAYGPDIVRLLLPHRPPLLLVDRITGIDLGARRIAGRRYLDPADPVFSGHFPDFPLYPGTLQVEATGQLGLCLRYFDSTGSVEAPTSQFGLNVRATRVLGAYYGEPAEPGTELTLLAEILSFDGYFASMIGQCLSGDRVTSVSAGEVLFV
ncbi:MAG TPA: 3-hydroxyacyl-ACP dehydratase FabZ family protein [Spirochaetia bacterium]|nr:3-hydroxyacyl-ACP dehydratase FabZ family protein [Spirochaetia bacterium]